MASRGAAVVTRQVKPLLSVDNAEARTRVLQLYKAWYRHIPTMVYEFDIPVSVAKSRDLLRDKFRSNAHIKDTRVIDMLVVKGQQDLQEVVEAWAQAPHIMSKHFKEAVKDRPKDFMGKFLSGHD